MLGQASMVIPHQRKHTTYWNFTTSGNTTWIWQIPYALFCCSWVLWKSSSSPSPMQAIPASNNFIQSQLRKWHIYWIFKLWMPTPTNVSTHSCKLATPTKTRSKSLGIGIQAITLCFIDCHCSLSIPLGNWKAQETPPTWLYDPPTETLFNTHTRMTYHPIRQVCKSFVFGSWKIIHFRTYHQQHNAQKLIYGVNIGESPELQDSTIAIQLSGSSNCPCGNKTALLTAIQEYENTCF